MEVNIFEKYQLLFKKLLKGDIKLSCSYSENILRKLEDSSDKDACDLLKTPSLADLVLDHIPDILEAHESVKQFVMGVFTVIFKNEKQFCYVSRFLEHCSVISLLEPNKITARLEIAHLHQITTLLMHKSGVTWLLHNREWEKMLQPDLCTKPPKLQRLIMDFTTKLVWVLNDWDDEVYLEQVVSHILNPVQNNEYVIRTNFYTEEENTIAEPLLPYLKILQLICDEQNIPRERNKVFPLIMTLPSAVLINKIFSAARVHEIVDLVAELGFKFCIHQAKSTNKCPNEVKFSYFYNQIVAFTQKRSMKGLVSFTINCIIFWTKINEQQLCQDAEVNNRRLLQKQFIVILITPLIAAIMKNGGADSYLKESIDEFKRETATKCHEHIISATYLIRDLTRTSNKEEVKIETVNQLFRLKGHLDREQAGLLFQALYFELRHHIVIHESETIRDVAMNDNFLKSPDDVKLFTMVLGVIKMLLQEHNINWYEFYEIFCLHTVLAFFLKTDVLPPKLQMQTLDLIGIGIRKSFPPEMTLLLTNSNHGTLNEVGTIIRKCMEHEDWEVRDSALTLLTICTDVAFVKYTPFQKMISKTKLMNLAVNYALNDSEYYVQASALKCLAIATRIESIWKEVDAVHCDLFIKLNRMLKNHPDDIVRQEAANVLTEIYINTKVTQHFVESVYKSMTIAALNDLQWEVQLAALNFWAQVIDTHLVNRGMIDGRFPGVTFSKEKRKIIQLNEVEIEKQLIGIVNDLSKIGCLTVLYKCFNEENSVEVMERAYFIAKKIIDVLDGYNMCTVPDIPNDLKIDDDVEVIEEDMVMDLSFPCRTMQDEIIDKIVSKREEDIIADMMERYVHVNNKYDDASITINILIDPNKFLRKFRNKYCLTKIEAKKCSNSYCSNLSNLLDEVLSLAPMPFIY